jgi:hypothetical protein
MWIGLQDFAFHPTAQQANREAQNGVGVTMPRHPELVSKTAGRHEPMEYSYCGHFIQANVHFPCIITSAFDFCH